MIVEMTYADFLELRRKESKRNQLSPVVTYTKTDANQDEYYIRMNVSGQVYASEARGADGTDFKDNRLPFCNKINKGDVVELESHNFSTKSSWRYGDKNSLYTFIPTTGKILIPRRFKIITDKSDSIANGQEIVFAIWQTIGGTSTPTLGISGTVLTGTNTTTFDLQSGEGSLFSDGDHIGITMSGTQHFRKISGSPSGDTITIDIALSSTPSADDVVTLYSPTPLPTTQTYAGGASTGWHLAHPIAGDSQEVNVWVYMLSGVPQYKVSVFRYGSIKSIRSKATNERILGNTHEMEFDYAAYENDVSLCHFCGERVEVFLNDDTEITPINSGEEHRITIMFKSMDEW